MDEEAELLVELAVDDVEVAVLLAESLDFSGGLPEASEVQRIPVHDLLVLLYGPRVVQAVGVGVGFGDRVRIQRVGEVCRRRVERAVNDIVWMEQLRLEWRGGHGVRGDGARRRVRLHFFFFSVLELLLFLLIRITEEMISDSLFTAFVIKN